MTNFDYLDARKRRYNAARALDPLEDGYRDPLDRPARLSEPYLHTAMELIRIGGMVSKETARACWDKFPSDREMIRAYANAHTGRWAA